MAVRKDQVQISVSFITDESKAYAKLIESNKGFINDLNAAKKKGEDVTATIRKMAAAAQGVQDTDLTQLVPAQLITRAKQLQQALQFIPQSAPEYAILNGEFKRINDRLATIRQQSRGVADGLGESATKFQALLQGVGAIVGGLSIDRILASLVGFGQQLYQLGIPMDFFAQKTKTVFGDASTIVQDFADQNATDLGLTSKEFVNLATSVGDLLVPIGFAQEEAAGFANEITKQSGILSEWQGGLVSTQRAHEILTDAVLGERDGLKQLGIQVDEDLIKQELKAKGLDKLTGSSLRQAEALITLEQVTKQSAAANENFAKNGDSAVRAQAKLRATIQGITEDLAKGLRPAFTALLNILASVVGFLAGFLRALLEIPKFVSENRVQIIALVVALVSLNAANIAAAASALRVAAVQKAQAIATTALTVAQRLLNVAMKSNPIGLVIAAISLLIAGFATAYQKSENFRASINGLGAIAAEIFKIIGESVKAFGSGFSKILKGDFSAGLKDIGDGLVKSNPIGIALTQGDRLKKAFVTGFEKSKLRDAQKKEAEDLAKNKKPFEAAGAANGDAYGKAFARLSATGEIDPKEAEKAAKEALELQLKAVEVAQARQRVLVEQNRLDNKLSESDYQKQLLQIQEQEYTKQLEVYRKFGQAQTLEAIELRKKLLQVQQDLQPNARIEVQALGNRAPADNVQSQTGATQRALDNIETESSLREKALKDAFRNALLVEEEYQLQSLELERNKIDRKLALLAEASGKELEDKRALEEKKAEIDEQILDKQADAAERRRKAEVNGILAVGDATRDLVGTAAELLAEDQENRRKNASAIKAFQKAEIIISGILEVQRIWANAAQYGPLAPVIGGIQTGIAAARSAFAIAKVDKQKFARGGMRRFGIFGGKPHANGGTKGVFDDGTQIEVERDEMFAVVNKRSTGMLQALSRLNEAGGGIPFMRSGGLFHLRTGGLAAINTTPNRLATAGSGGVDISPILAQVDRMIVALQTPRNLKANIVYSEYEATRNEVQEIQADAAI
jgi:hypothetical protein